MVEDGADPAILFDSLHALLRQWLRTLRPYCAQEVDEDDEEVDQADRKAWVDAQAELAAVPLDTRWEVESLQQAVDVLVLPMMAMLMRSQRNHEAFIADTSLMALLHPMATTNDSFPFEELHFCGWRRKSVMSTSLWWSCPRQNRIRGASAWRQQ